MKQTDYVRTEARGTDDSGDVRNATVINPERGDNSQFGALEQHAVASQRETSNRIDVQILFTTGKLH